MHASYAQLLELAAPYLDTRRNDIHVQEVLRLAEVMLREVDAHEDVVIPALILHDVGWKMVPENLQLKAFGPRPFDEELRRIHEVEGARLAAEILAAIGYDQAKAGQIVHIVDGHDSRLEALSIDDMVVKDCDKLSRLCRAGFNIDSERFGIPPHEYARWLEEQIDAWFFTDTAKRLARDELKHRQSEITLGGASDALQEA